MSKSQTHRVQVTAVKMRSNIHCDIFSRCQRSRSSDRRQSQVGSHRYNRHNGSCARRQMSTLFLVTLTHDVFAMLCWYEISDLMSKSHVEHVQKFKATSKLQLSVAWSIEVCFPLLGSLSLVALDGWCDFSFLVRLKNNKHVIRLLGLVYHILPTIAYLAEELKPKWLVKIWGWSSTFFKTAHFLSAIHSKCKCPRSDVSRLEHESFQESVGAVVSPELSTIRTFRGHIQVNKDPCFLIVCFQTNKHICNLLSYCLSCSL